MSLLHYQNLSISFGTGRREKFAVNQLDLEIGLGERLALVGESGSGKTLTALAPLRLEPEGAKVSGKILWKKRDVTDGQSEVSRLRHLPRRGRCIERGDYWRSYRTKPLGDGLSRREDGSKSD